MIQKLPIIFIALFIVSCNSVTPDEQYRAWSICKEYNARNEFMRVQYNKNESKEYQIKFEEAKRLYSEASMELNGYKERCKESNCNYDNVKKLVLEECGLNVSF